MSSQILDAKLGYEVFTVKRAGIQRDVPPGNESLQWVANSSTLIFGRHEAALVDTFGTIDQNRQLGDWIEKSGKTLRWIYITHAHGDHAFGIQMLLDRFPQARAIATAPVVEGLKAQTNPEFLKRTWHLLFPGQVPEILALPEVLAGNEFELEGNKLLVMDEGFTDTFDTTSLYVPSLELIVAGDVVYNGIHPLLRETSEESRQEWLRALDRLEALSPRFVVAGHKVPEHDDSPQHIEATRAYLKDFERVRRETHTALELYQGMLALHPERVNPGSLWGGSLAAKNK